MNGSDYISEEIQVVTALNTECYEETLINGTVDLEEKPPTVYMKHRQAAEIVENIPEEVLEDIIDHVWQERTVRKVYRRVVTSDNGSGSVTSSSGIETGTLSTILVSVTSGFSSSITSSMISVFLGSST